MEQDVWRCDVTKNPVGTDTRPAGVPCKCQACTMVAKIGWLEGLLRGRDNYIVSIGRWQDFCDGLPD